MIAGGRIAAIGPAGTPVPPEAQTIDLSGLDVWPGMVDAGSTIGLFEIGSLAETQDHSDAAQYQPELRTSTAIHPDSEHFGVTRANGVLTSLVQPTGGIISGQGCLIDLNGWVPREMVIADRLTLDIRIPPYVSRTAGSRRPGLGPNRPGPGPGGAPAGENAAAEARKKLLDKIKELFHTALAYDGVVTKSRERGESPPAPDLRLEALVPYARGEKLVILHANQPVEILDALDIARELKLKAVISGGAEAWKVADALKQAKLPVLIEGALNLPRHEHDPYDSAYANAAKLHAAGVTFAIHSKSGGASGETAARNLPFEAAAAIAFGLPEEVGLKAVTLTPAQILGVADQVGSLENGKRANVVITAGHLLQPTTPVLALFIDGEPLRPRAVIPSFTQSIAGASTRSGQAGLNWESTRHPPSSPAPARSARHPSGLSGNDRFRSDDLGRHGRRCMFRAPTLRELSRLGRDRLGRRQSQRVEIGFEHPAELLEVVRPADVFRYAHPVHHRRLIDPIPVGDHEHRGFPGKHRGRPEQPVQLLVPGTLPVPVENHEPGMNRLQDRARVRHGAGHNHTRPRPGLATKLLAQNSQESIILGDRQNCRR